jgi:5-(carboxyamino)imidazole ribonucleotide synthase
VTTVGVIGAGQLGQMLGLAGRSLDLRFLFLDPAHNPPAKVAGPVLAFAFDDPEGIRQLAARSDLVTYEFENVPVYPSAEALRNAQDRLVEKQLFERLGIPVAAFRAVDSIDDLQQACHDLNFPFVLKTRRLGYDGKGQAIVRNAEQQVAAWRRLGRYPLIAEEWIPFDREVSVIGARRPGGDMAVYPVTENRHVSGILRQSTAPIADAAISDTAQRYLRDLLRHLDYVGVMALELFVVDGRLLANEFAPRVHNSGHWTIEGAVTSQFENHLRAILDLPLGDPAARGYAAMLNLVGEMPCEIEAFAAAGFSLHDYGKEPRPARKLGHLTIVADTAAGRDERVKKALQILKL